MFVENKTTEFKREYVEEIRKTIVAFANCDGGTVYIGVNDDGSVCGVEDPDGTLLRVSNMIRDVVRPDVTLFVECRLEEMEGRPVVCVAVQRGTARPYYLHGKGIRPEGVYVRQGAATVPASEAAILAMIKETSGDSYEEARSLRQQLTFDKAAEFFRKRALDFAQAQMRTLHLIGEDGTYTNLAFLLSEQNTHSIKLAVFEGSKKTVFKDRKELSGSLFAQLEDAFAYIDRFNRTRSEFEGLDRIDLRDYPVEAVREALLNAIVHRDYSFSGPILISLFDDRMEFVTIGGLVKGLSYEDVMLGVSALRNPNLANVFYRLKLIEAYGTGILKIRECYDGQKLQPMVEVTDHAFKITLPNLNYAREQEKERLSGAAIISDRPLYGYASYPSSGRAAGYASAPVAAHTSGAMSAPVAGYVPESAGMERRAASVAGYAPEPAGMEERTAAVVHLCRERGSLVRRDLEEGLQVSQATAILILRSLTQQGILIKKGRARNTRYYLNPAKK